MDSCKVRVEVSRTKAIEAGRASWGLLEVDAAEVQKLLGSDEERAAFAAMVSGRYAKEGVVCSSVAIGEIRWVWIFATAEPSEVAAAIASFAKWQVELPKLRAEKEALATRERVERAIAQVAKTPEMAMSSGCRNAIEKFLGAIDELRELGMDVETCVGGEFWNELGRSIGAALAEDRSSRWISNDLILKWEDEAKRRFGGRVETVLAGVMREAMRERREMDQASAATAKAELEEKTARRVAGELALEEWAREHAAERFAPALDEGYPCVSEIDDVVLERLKDEVELCFGPDVIFDEFSPRLELAKDRSAPTPEVLEAAKELGNVARNFKAPAGYEITLTRVIRVEVSSDRHEGPLTGVGITVACPLWSARSWFVSLEMVPETNEDEDAE